MFDSGVQSNGSINLMTFGKVIVKWRVCVLCLYILFAVMFSLIIKDVKTSSMRPRGSSYFRQYEHFDRTNEISNKSLTYYHYCSKHYYHNVLGLYNKALS